MPGALVHLAVAAACLLIVHFIHYKWEYSLSVFVGNLLPDTIKFGFSAIKQGTINLFHVKQDATYSLLNQITSSYANWFTFGFFIFGLTMLLYHFHYIKKKKMDEYNELYVFLLIGIVVHLILDVLFIENGPWI